MINRFSFRLPRNFFISKSSCHRSSESFHFNPSRKNITRNLLKMNFYEAISAFEQNFICWNLNFMLNISNIQCNFFSRNETLVNLKVCFVELNRNTLAMYFCLLKIFLTFGASRTLPMTCTWTHFNLTSHYNPGFFTFVHPENMIRIIVCLESLNA